jgi:hypothetical protein
MRRVRALDSLALVALVLCTAACGADEVESPPMNTAITNEARPLEPGCFTLPFEVACNGPDDELALLDGVCGAKTDFLSWSATDAPAGMAMWVGPRKGPLFLVFNRLDREPSATENVARELRYAAYFVRRGMADDVVDTLEQWREGEPVKSGSVITFDAHFEACRMSWEALGVFLWRSTTIAFSWTAAHPC